MSSNVHRELRDIHDEIVHLAARVELARLNALTDPDFSWATYPDSALIEAVQLLWRAHEELDEREDEE